MPVAPTAALWSCHGGVGYDARRHMDPLQGASSLVARRCTATPIGGAVVARRLSQTYYLINPDCDPHEIQFYDASQAHCLPPRFGYSLI